MESFQSALGRGLGIATHVPKSNSLVFRWLLVIALTVFGASQTIAQHDHNDPDAVHEEHAALFDLVPHDEATHMAMQSGAWGDASTWHHGHVPMTPADGSDIKVLIPEGVEVELNYINYTVHKTIRVDGTLSFAPNVNTGLMVDTLIVGVNGHLEMGSADAPVQQGVEAKIIIADTGDIDTMWDPTELSRGLISHGRLSMFGAEKKGHLDLVAPVNQGDTTLVLAGEPTGWQVNDLLILPGTHQTRDYDETLRITDVTGNVVTVVGLDEAGMDKANWSGLSNKHKLPNDLLPFVINVSRNVVVESQNVTHADDMGINRRRGHLMVMHSGVPKTHVRYAAVYGLGRTDKRTPLESPELNDHGHRIADRGHNAAGRYAFHFHRGGPAEHHAAMIHGLAIVDSPGLGLVNHSSHVNVTDSVAYHVVGSAFFTEAGDEFGTFDSCAAIRMTGSGEGFESRGNMRGGVIQETDFGHSGHGFWLQGGGVSVTDARVAGSGSAAVIFFTVPLNEPGIGTARFDGSLVSAEISGGREKIGVGTVPFTFEGGMIFGNRKAIQTKFHQLGSRHKVASVVKDVTTVSTGTPLSIPYTNNLHVENCTFVGTETKPNGGAMSRNGVTRNVTFDEMDVRWFFKGLDMPSRGHNQVIGGVFQNIRDINISTTNDGNRLIELQGNIQFPELTEAQLTRKKRRKVYQEKRYEIYLKTNYNPKHRDLTKLFARDIIRLATIKYQDHQLFYYAQAADFIPFPADRAADYVPIELIDKTNGELWASYGLSIGDAVAPADAFEDPLIHALVGEPITYAPKIKLRSRKYTNQLANYQGRYRTWENGKRKNRSVAAVDLREDWNLITFTEQGQLRTLLVFGDIIPPSFIASSRLPDVINPADLARGFRVTGRIYDNSFGSKMFKKTFRGHHLLAMPVQTDASGDDFIMLNFVVKDFAGNTTPSAYRLGLDEDETLDHIKRRKRLKKRRTVEALHYLLGFSTSNSGT